MNASGTLRASFVRLSRLSFHTGHISQIRNWPNFTVVEYLEYRARCEMEREQTDPAYDPFDIEKGTSVDIDVYDEKRSPSRSEKVKRMFTVFPYRDPTWIVAVVFAMGSIDFTINAFFGLLPLVAPSTMFETEATVAFPATIFIGAFMFTAAGIVDFFGAFNADRGVVEVASDEKDEKKGGTLRHRPALIGSENWTWIPSKGKFTELLLSNKPFQAGVVQMFGGVVFTVSAFAGFSGLVDPMDPIFPTVVFTPQVIGGFLFLFANAMLAVCCEQERWWRPKPSSAGWQAAFQSAIGGLGFMLAGVFLLQNKPLESAVATFVGSWTFLFGSLIGWYAIMDIC